jgi:hypothetical protein
MSNLPAFAEYAAAFEETLKDDDWSRLEKYFKDDSSYLPGDGTEGKGRAGALAAMKSSVDSLERKVDGREIIGEPGVSEKGDTITLTFTIKYTRQGMEDFTLVGKEVINYADGLIQRMEDIFDNADALIEWRSKL